MEIDDLLEGDAKSVANAATRENGAKVVRTDFAGTLADVPPLVPEEQDPNVLFRHNWLAKGQAATGVATSGVGKSSMTMQTAFKWAAGEPWLAVPMRPLKCAIIQSEDSERDLGEQLEGMRWGLKELHGWTDEKFDQVKGRILCPTAFLGMTGQLFVNELRRFQSETRCDMIFVNPIQAFFGADVSDQERVSEFTRRWLDPILKSEEYGCCAFIVMHTTKIKSGENYGRANVNDYGEYIGAGSHEWLDWCRARFVFMKKGDSEDYFDFKAAKRGKRLGWTDADGKRTTNKVFKHSEGHIFWQEVTDAGELAEIPAAHGRPGKEKIAVEKSAIAIATKYTGDLIGIGRREFMEKFWQIDRRAHSRADYGEVFDYLAANADRFGLRAVESVKKNGAKIMTLEVSNGL